MRCTSPKTSTTSGFTLVEILIIAPIVILMIAGFVGLIITVTGDVLRIKGSSDLIYTTQDALNRIEQDVQRTTEFRQISYTPTSPQGQADNTTAFDTIAQANTYLVLRSLTTDKSPVAADRSLVYKMVSSACTTAPYTVDVVYFTKTVSSVTSLWRRVVTGNTAEAGDPCTGTTAWQVSTCSPGYTNTTVCKTDDTLMLENVSTISLQYLNSTGTQINTTTPTAGTSIKNPYDAAGTGKASSISLSLSVSNTVAGRDSSYTGSLAVSKPPAVSE